MTSGGINEDIAIWFDLRYFKYETIHKKWQYHLFRMVKSCFDTPEINEVVDELWKKYPKGLVANVSKGNVPEGGYGLARYLAKLGIRFTQADTTYCVLCFTLETPIIASCWRSSDSTNPVNYSN